VCLRARPFVKDTFPPALPPHKHYHNERYTMTHGEAFCVFPALMNRSRPFLCNRSRVKEEGEAMTASRKPEESLGRSQETRKWRPGTSQEFPGGSRRPQEAPGASRKAPSEEQKDFGSVSDGSESSFLRHLRSDMLNLFIET
jgi:hypothetical protein